ncbi:hypothetical protein ACFL5V_05420, partial [Fibrobacterota bacterium]
PVFKNDMIQSEADAYVWPYAKGRARGLAVSPLSKSAPEAALRDVKLYDFLALTDAMRIGKARERSIAAGKLTSMIKKMEKDGR